ncbi:hypothetical protein OXV69_00205 [Bacteroides fragilis]|nr:hypothetical protein [Bacteroides fragilis]
MAANKLIDVSKLNEALVIYDQALRALPFATLTEVANLLKLNVMDLQGKHARINERRRAGGTQSYKIGKNFGLVDKLLGYEPSVIEPKDVVCITKENSQKYDDNELLIIGGTPVSNTTKKHPMETKVAFTWYVRIWKISYIACSLPNGMKIPTHPAGLSMVFIPRWIC